MTPSIDASLDPAGLLARVAAGDRAAFAALYQASSAKLFGVVLRIVRRRDVAEEVLQEVYVRIFERADRFDPAAGSAMGWLATVARNRALDHARRRADLFLDDMPGAEAVASLDEGPYAAAERSDTFRRLASCLDQLDEEKRRLVLLAYLKGWTRDDLARHFGLPVGTVKTWLHRSLARLKECVGP